MYIQQVLKVSSRFKPYITVCSAKSHFVDTLRNLNSIYGIIKKKYFKSWSWVLGLTNAWKKQRKPNNTKESLPLLSGTLGNGHQAVPPFCKSKINLTDWTAWRSLNNCPSLALNVTLCTLFVNKIAIICTSTFQGDYNQTTQQLQSWEKWSVKCLKWKVGATLWLCSIISNNLTDSHIRLSSVPLGP